MNSLMIYNAYYTKMGDKLKVCPTNAITMLHGKAVIDIKKCIGCGRCVFGIPNPNKLNDNSSSQLLSESVKDTEVILKKNDEQVSNPKTTIDLSNNKVSVAKVKPKALNFVSALKCIGCQLCVPECPTQAISMNNSKAVIDETKCIGCGICKNGTGIEDGYGGCPAQAITLNRLVQTSK